MTIGRLFSATAKIVIGLPVAAVVDTVTLGGVLTQKNDSEEPKSALAETLKSIDDDVRRVRK